MHDDRLEGRVRSALRTEADSLSFTITAEELGRRLALRRRSRFGRPMQILLAAAVGIGLVGAGLVSGGAFDRLTRTPTPSQPNEVVAGPSTSVEPTKATLPTLDELIRAGGADRLVLAQANGPFDGPAAEPNGIALDPPSLNFGRITQPGAYQISLACLGPTKAMVGFEDLAKLGPILTPTQPCDAAVHNVPSRIDGTAMVVLGLDARASWRLAVHRLDEPVAVATGEPEIPEPAATEDVLERISGSPLDVPPGESMALVFPTRETYTVRLSCVDAPTVRYGFGEDPGGIRTMSTTTVVPCDGAVHTARLAIGELFGSQLFVRPDTGASWHILVTDAHLPIALASAPAGWLPSSGIGPSYVTRPEPHGVSLVAHEKSGPVLLVISCLGSGTISGTVDTGLVEGRKTVPFQGSCTPDGATFSDTYQVDGANVDVSYTAPPRSYVAISVFEPKP